MTGWSWATYASTPAHVITRWAHVLGLRAQAHARWATESGGSPTAQTTYLEEWD